MKFLYISLSYEFHLNYLYHLFSFLSFRMELNFEPDYRNSSFSVKDPLGRTPLQVGIEVTIAVLICLACIAGNVTVVIAIHKTPRLKTVTNMLVENLAWTDISMATLHLPFWIMSMSSGRWLLSHVACKIVGFSELVFGVASLQTMAGIALNRYFSTVRRNLFIKYFSDRKATLKIIIVSWVLPVVVCSPPLYGWGTIEFSEKFTDCTMGWNIPDISYISFLLSVAIVIPMVVIICCYFAIFRFVRRSSRQIQNHLQEESHRRLKNNAPSIKKETKVIKVFVAVVIVYVSCWTPVCIVGICEIIEYSAPRWVYIVVYYMMFSSSFCNPLIYGLFNPQFRNAFKKLYNKDASGNDSGELPSQRRTAFSEEQ